MAEETFWIVKFRFKRDEDWRLTPSMLCATRQHAIDNYKDTVWNDWRGERRRGLVRCIEVRVVPVT